MPQILSEKKLCQKYIVRAMIYQSTSAVNLFLVLTAVFLAPQILLEKIIFQKHICQNYGSSEGKSPSAVSLFLALPAELPCCHKFCQIINFAKSTLSELWFIKVLALLVYS
jgi:hypothetical protein